jgi:hypothetical protein
MQSDEEIADAITDVNDNLNKLKTEKLEMFDDTIFLITGATMALFDLQDNLTKLSVTEKSQFETFVEQVKEEMSKCKRMKAKTKEQKFVIERLEEDFKLLEHSPITEYSVEMNASESKHNLRGQPPPLQPSSKRRSNSAKRLSGTLSKRIQDHAHLKR